MALTQTDRRNLGTLAGLLITAGIDDGKRVKELQTAAPQLLAATLKAPTTSADELERLSAVPAKDELDQAPKALQHLLLRLLGTPTVQAVRDALPAVQRPRGRLDAPASVSAAAIRVALEGGYPESEDIETVKRWLAQLHQRRHVQMAIEFRAEARGLPGYFDPVAFAAAVNDTLEKVYKQPAAGNEAYHAVVIGKLLLEGQLIPGSPGFDATLRQAYLAGLDTTTGKRDPQTGAKARIPNHVTYAKVADALAELPGHGKSVAYQELASVAEYLVDEADAWPVDDDASFGTRVQLGLNRYIDGTADVGFAALDLPALVSEDASEQEIEPGHVQAVGFIAAAAELEGAGVFDVVDRMVDLFLQGMLPVGNDQGGAALNRYYWDADERLDAAARAAQYARVLGIGGGEAGQDVQPNVGFEDLLLRFMSSVARYDADMRVANLFDGRSRDLTGSSEYVRAAGHAVAMKASLYGWGFTTFAARSLKRHVDLAFEVLSEPTLQRAYGVTGPWQLVERVQAIELGGSYPNIVQCRTNAKAKKDVLDTLAKYSRQLSVSGANGRFLPGPGDFVLDGGGGAAVSLTDYELLVNAAHNLLAVNGIGSDEIERMSQPAKTTGGPSIPTVGGNGGASMNGDTGAGAVDQIRQLVAQGQVPSLEQLQRLLPMGS